MRLEKGELKQEDQCQQEMMVACTKLFARGKVDMLELRHIIKIEPTGFADGLDVEQEGKAGI